MTSRLVLIPRMHLTATAQMNSHLGIRGPSASLIENDRLRQAAGPTKKAARPWSGAGAAAAHRSIDPIPRFRSARLCAAGGIGASRHVLSIAET